MKKVKLSQLKDGQKFILSKRRGIKYKLISKKGKMGTYTSLSSELSFTRSLSTVVYI